MRISAFDLDGTLLIKNSSFAFCTYLFRKKILSFTDFLTCIFCYLLHKYCGASLKWLHHAVFKRLFRGKKITFLAEHIETFLDENLQRFLYLPAIKRLQQRKAENNHLIILSNSPIFLVKAIARRLQVDEIFATDYVVGPQGELCGIANIVDGHLKAAYLSKISCTEKEVYTDSLLDLPFLHAASKKIVVKPCRGLKKLAKTQGWERL